MEITTILFLIFSIFAIASAIGTVASKHPIVSAMNLVFHFLMLAGLFLTLNAQFIAVLQVLVYAGAIMVLVIFVIMLLNLGKEEQFGENFNARKGVGLAFGTAFAVQIFVLFIGVDALTSEMPASAVENGYATILGNALFTDYLFAFEYIAILLLVAIVGALLLGKKHVFTERD